MTDITTEPSHNPDAERCVLGSILIRDDLLDDPRCGLVADDFHSDRHKTIHAACRRLHEAGKAVDFETVGNALAVAGTLDAAGGLDYLDEVMDSVPHAGHAHTYAADVREHTRRRMAGYAVREAGTLDPLALAEAARAVDERFPPLGLFQPAGGWPDPKPVPGLPPVPPLDAGLLPAPFRPWLADVADRIQCPPDFLAAGAMVALAAVVGRRVAVRPERYDDWTVVPNLWGGVVAPPSFLKTPALKTVMVPLHGLEAAAWERHAADLEDFAAGEIVGKQTRKLLETQIAKAEKGGDHAGALDLARQIAAGEAAGEPAPVRYVVNDPTVEKLGEIMRDNPRGVLAFRDELTGLLRGLDRDGQEQARAFYLEAWNGDGSFTFDRIARGSVRLSGMCLSVLGGIQPGPLGDYQRATAGAGKGDDGLLQRFQFVVWPDMPRTWRKVSRWPDTPAKRDAHAVFARLDGIDAAAVGAEEPDDAGVPFLRFDAGGQAAFDGWRAALEDRLRSGELPAGLGAHLGKYRSLVPTLALLTHLAEGGTGPIPADAATRAVAWADYLEGHAGRLYAATARPELKAAEDLRRKIVKDAADPAGLLRDGFAARDVYRNGVAGLGTAAEAAAALSLLVDLGVLAEERRDAGTKSRTVYRVNPKVAAPAGVPARPLNAPNTPDTPPAAAGTVGSVGPVPGACGDSADGGDEAGAVR